MSGYLERIRLETGTDMWCDSPNPPDLTRILGLGAVGATSNPPLVLKTVQAQPERLEDFLNTARAQGGLPNWNLTRRVVTEASELLRPLFESSKGVNGLICLQVDPRNWNNTPAMVEMAKEAYATAPNIAVKIPVTKAGVDAIEELAAIGITTTATVNYTVPQVIAVAEAFERGYKRAEAAGKLPTNRPMQSFNVLMVGRLDDHLRDVVREQAMDFDQEIIKSAGVAVAKKAYRICKERGYKSRLLIAALRGNYQIFPFIGGDLVITMFPNNETEFGAACGNKVPPVAIDEPVPQANIDKLSAQFVDFRKAYEVDYMKPEEFDTFGSCVKTLKQFSAAWEDLIKLFEPVAQRS